MCTARLVMAWLGSIPAQWESTCLFAGTESLFHINTP